MRYGGQPFAAVVADARKTKRSGLGHCSFRVDFMCKRASRKADDCFALLDRRLIPAGIVCECMIRFLSQQVDHTPAEFPCFD